MILDQHTKFVIFIFSILGTFVFGTLSIANFLIKNYDTSLFLGIVAVGCFMILMGCKTPSKKEVAPDKLDIVIAKQDAIMQKLIEIKPR